MSDSIPSVDISNLQHPESQADLQSAQNNALDTALLRRFEPIIHYTRGEQFFPMCVEPYIQACSLWVQREYQPAYKLVDEGHLTLDRLGQPYSDEFGAVHFLKCTDPLGALDMASFHRQNPEKKENTFHVGYGRLARVGYISRLVDALFQLALFARGRVPGDTAAAAELQYERMMAENQHYCYYGRVVRQNGWLVLQYWFFYPFNNWRSGFSGANDHEADWEMICIYLSEDSSEEQSDIDTLIDAYKPEWIAYASHDYHGDDLRRQWDDPEVKKEDTHPVIYAGAGSHASYFSKGEYLTELELPFLAPIIRVSDTLQRFWREQLRQYAVEDTADNVADNEESASNLFRIPFVDYARGDGLTIGPGQALEWGSPRLLTPSPAWVTNFRGLWGLYARDPFAGEDAPAGPMYNRDGSVRLAWYDPIGWAGLNKVPTEKQRISVILDEQAEIRQRQIELSTQLDKKIEVLKGLGVQVAAIRQQPHLVQIYEEKQAEIEKLTREVDEIQATLTVDYAVLEALEQYEHQTVLGLPEPPRAHIQRAHQPASLERLRVSRIAEFWAATSVGFMLFVLVILGYFAPEYFVFGLATILSLFIFIEAGFRGRLTRFVTSLTIGLALTSTIILIYEFYWQVIILGVLGIGVYILWENLHELWS